MNSKKQKNSKHQAYGIYEKFLKRPFDFVFSLMLLIILSPILIVTAIFVWINLGWPIIFKQKRPGKDEKIFELYKFRTMSNERDRNGRLLSDEKRLTKFGKILRTTSLDEFPELLNILKGDMSFVGPRPLLVKYLPYYTKKEHHRHDIRPGLTGWAQVNGRNGVDWDERFNFDLEYVNRITMLFDLKIIVLTFVKVFTEDGIQMGDKLSLKNLDEERKNDL